MILYYTKNGMKSAARESDDNVTISVGVSDNRRTVTVTAKSNITLLSAVKEASFKHSDDDSLFLNGFQSWTDTKEFTFSEKQKDLSSIPKALVDKYAFAASGDQSFYAHKKNVLHAFDVAYLKGRNELFIGNCNYKNAYLIIEFCKNSDTIFLRSDIEGKTLSEGESFTVFDYLTFDSVKDGVEKYFGSMKPASDRKLFGYTSWYNHYQNISEEIITKALDEADERFELFQIDDGFEPFVGDWLKTDERKFPNGLAPIVEKIHSRGMLAGIWLAPLAAEKDSELVKNHPELIAKDEKGNFIKAGANWSGFYPLDLNNPDAIEYVRTTLRHYTELGFDFFKLDFLYASVLSPIDGMTRSETSEYIYDILRSELKGKLILGCGATLANAFEKFDYMRIGPDVSLEFDDVFYMRFMHRERISTKVTLQNTIYRSIMNGCAFMNDPDVFLLRDDNIKLSRKQRFALTTVNALFGSLMMTSDNPLGYDEKKKKLLDTALDIFRNRENVSYRRRGEYIDIKFTLKGKTYSVAYDTKKGVITNG